MFAALAVASGGLTVGAAEAAAIAPAISCPSVAGQVGEVPARAQAEVQRNLQLSESQSDR